MKSIFYLTIIFVSTLLLISNIDRQFNICVVDQTGTTIWPIDEHKLTVELSFIDRMSNKTILNNMALPDKAYLERYNASTLQLWSYDKNRDKKIYKEYILEFSTATIESKRIKPSRTPQEQIDYLKSIEGKIKNDATNPNELNEWRLARKGGKIEPQKMRTAFKEVRKLEKSQSINNLSKDAGLNTWNNLGPNNTGGRIRAIAINPDDANEIFVGSVAGGLWQSTDAGNTWSTISDFLPNMAITQIVFDPNDTNIMYASTGEGFNSCGIACDSISPGIMNVGIGVLKSTDGGISWTVLPSPAEPFHWVNDIVIDPNNSQHIYAVTSNDASLNTPSGANGAIYKSINGGMSWQQITTTITRAYDIKIDPNNSNNILVGCNSNLYRTTNATTQDPANIVFTEITDGPNQILCAGRVELSYAANVANRVFALVDDNANGGEIWRSNDGGTTWTERTSVIYDIFNWNSGSASDQGWYDNVIWVDPLNSNNILVGGIDIWRSSNGGTTLTKVSDWNDDIHQNDNDGDGNQSTSIHGDQHAIVIPPDYSAANRKVYVGNDGGIYSTNDFTTVSQNIGWNDLNNGIQITQFYGGAASTDRSLVIGGAQDNSFNVTRTFSGSTWFIPYSGDGAFAAVDYNNENIAYANTNNNQIFQSIDNGQTFNWIACFNCGVCVNGCVNAAGTLFTALDGASLISKFTMDPNNPNIIYSLANQLWMNNNAGNVNNWSSIRASNGGQLVAMDVGSNSNTIWIGTANGNVEVTTVGGGAAANWTIVDDVAASLIPERFITDIAIDKNDDNKVMVTVGGYSQDNIWYTDDGGVTWTNRSLNFDMQVNSVVWHPLKSGWAYIGTDFGIFATEDAGQNWMLTSIYNDNEGPFNGEVSELFWAGDGSDATPYYLFAATHGRGMWRSTNPIMDKIYVDKLYTGIETGSITQPYNTFQEAINSAAPGVEIIFLSTGTHNDISSPLIIDKRMQVILQNGGNAIIIE